MTGVLTGVLDGPALGDFSTILTGVLTGVFDEGPALGSASAPAVVFFSVKFAAGITIEGTITVADAGVGGVTIALNWVFGVDDDGILIIFFCKVIGVLGGVTGTEHLTETKFLWKNQKKNN